MSGSAMADARAVAHAAGNATPLEGRGEAIIAARSGRPVYGLLRDHSRVVRIHGPGTLSAHEWAGYWVGRPS